MVSAIKPFRKLQLGLEATSGTLVAATQQLLGEWAYGEEDDRYRAGYPRGVNANVGGAGVSLRKGVSLSVEGDLTAEEMPWLLGSGVKGGIAGGTVADSAYTRTYTPQLTTAPTGPDTVTMEFVESDGSTNHVARKAGYGFLDGFEISSSLTENVKLKHDWRLRASQTSTPTSSLGPMTGIEPLVHGLAKFYVDTTYAGMGGTQLTGIVHNVTFKYMSPFEPKYTMDGRSDLDFTGLHISRGFRATLDITCELDATGATAWVTAWRSNLLRYIRQDYLGSLIGVTAVKTVRIDGAYRFVAPPTYDEETRIVTASLESVYDTTGTKTLDFVVINAIATVPA